MASNANAIMTPFGPPYTSTKISHIELSTTKLFLNSWNSGTSGFDPTEITPLATYGNFGQIVPLLEGYYLTVHPATQTIRVISINIATSVAIVHSTSSLPTTAPVNSIVVSEDGTDLVASVSSDRARSYPISKTTLLIGAGGQ